MQHWNLGNTRITRIEELTGPLFDPVTFFPDYSPEIVEKHRDWIYPNHIDSVSGNIIASMHSWLIETPHHKILVDTCVGNDKDRMPYRDWHRMQSPWPNNFKATGVTPDQIDFVMCTHLHIDHVGWNTRLENGQWVPTFPNAKYVFSEIEFEFWKEERNAENPDVFKKVNNQVFDDSVLPIVRLAEMINGEVDLIDDLLHISPAPGHTPGSITLALSSEGDKALFTGDICHHPIQVYEPNWNSAFCEIPDEAISTRRAMLERCVESNALMMPAHFGPSFVGHVLDSGTGFSFKFCD
ncbi:MAG: MBL fold metallo-hydrolase [Gammaproteobacteria bacterium]|jgi:glyoxylase-like metal-dependent hydrolase (beta-lactamase superfamily II)|nr:MBL fold metallo-hydrolase [Gammaproteobacteria bacterium]|tara:strand:- start:1413 stop:2300 length:888 start_codon:yes stop_codon:yes gene_type:complete